MWVSSVTQCTEKKGHHYSIIFYRQKQSSSLFFYSYSSFYSKPWSIFENKPLSSHFSPFHHQWFIWLYVGTEELQIHEHTTKSKQPWTRFSYFYIDQEMEDNALRRCSLWFLMDETVWQILGGLQIFALQFLLHSQYTGLRDTSSAPAVSLKDQRPRGTSLPVTQTDTGWSFLKDPVGDSSPSMQRDLLVSFQRHRLPDPSCTS